MDLPSLETSRISRGFVYACVIAAIGCLLVQFSPWLATYDYKGEGTSMDLAYMYVYKYQSFTNMEPVVWILHIASTLTVITCIVAVILGKRSNVKGSFVAGIVALVSTVVWLFPMIYMQQYFMHQIPFEPRYPTPYFIIILCIVVSIIMILRSVIANKKILNTDKSQD